jgi:hypothetical protein
MLSNKNSNERVNSDEVPVIRNFLPSRSVKIGCMLKTCAITQCAL